MLNIIPEKTAIKTGVSKSAIALNKEENKNKLIIDYGAGKLRNTLYLQKKGFEVIPIDTIRQVSNWDIGYKENNVYYTIDNLNDLEGKADFVICSYVLNVISDLKERDKVLQNIKKLIKREGTVYIEVRSIGALKSTKYKETYLDGFIVGKNKEKTFQKEFTKIDIENLLSKNGFKVIKLECVNQSIKLVCKIEE